MCKLIEFSLETAGQKFDMESKTFTLGNMFAMRLHQYAAEISEITNAAIEELTIESELKKLGDVWKAQKFDLFKYTKGGLDDRGWILKSLSSSQHVDLSRTLNCTLQKHRMDPACSRNPRLLCGSSCDSACDEVKGAYGETASCIYLQQAKHCIA